jgi:hypothetical protein
MQVADIGLASDNSLVRNACDGMESISLHKKLWLLFEFEGNSNLTPIFGLANSRRNGKPIPC